MTAASTASAAPVPRRSRATYERLTRAIGRLDLAADKKEWMRDRWLDQVLWFDRRAAQSSLRHSLLRIIAITGGVLVPGLVSLTTGAGSADQRQWAKGLAFGVSLLVAVAVGLDGFFHYGERWRHFRRTAELLKTEGWLFIEGGGRYKEHQRRDHFHDRAFPLFATKVEELIRRDVEIYLTRIVQEKPEDTQRESEEVGAYLDAASDVGVGSPPGTPEGSTVSSTGSP